jgi:hypothetical protein
MIDWLTYSLSDVVPFSREAYLRLFELYNRRFWPAGAIGLALGLGMLWLLDRPGAGRIRMSLSALAVCWLWIAWAFHRETYAQLNWAAPYAAAAFAAQGLMLFAVAFAFGRSSLVERTDKAARIGVALAALAILATPLPGLAWDRSWQGLELFGSAPDPTILATLGLMLLIRHWLRPLLMIVPMTWSLASGLTLLALGDPLWPVLPGLASAVLASAVWQWRVGPSRSI